MGDSASGKTWLTLTCFAEACLNKEFKDYRFIFDDVEGGAKMDMEFYFGKEVAKRVEAPSTKRGKPVFSEKVEDFYYHITDALDDGRPFIYVLDSQDALFSKSAQKKFKIQKGAEVKQEEVAGSYGDGKAKYHSENLRHVLSRLRRSGSILIIIGQTRDNLGFGFEKKTRSGGRSLDFYANIIIWTSVKGKIQKHIRGKDRTLGNLCIAEVRKNRVTGKIGKDRSVVIPIYNAMGIDDVGSCVDFLISEGHWTVVKGEKTKAKTYDAPDIMFQGSRNRIISYIEEEDLEEKVRGITGDVWREIEEACRPKRKRRYE